METNPHISQQLDHQELWERYSLSLQKTMPHPVVHTISSSFLPVTPLPERLIVESDPGQPSNPPIQSKKQILIRLFTVAVVLVLAVTLYFTWQTPTPNPSSSGITPQNFSTVALKVTPGPTSSISGTTAGPSTSANNTIQAYIVGAVKHPGVYILEIGARVYQLLQAAGGPLPKANLVAINLAARLSDGQEVYVSLVGETPPTNLGTGGGPTSSSSGPLVNINTATASDLRQKLSLSSKSAQAIVTYRLQHGNFTSVDQLLQVFSKTTYNKIKDLVTTS